MVVFSQCAKKGMIKNVYNIYSVQWAGIISASDLSNKNDINFDTSQNASIDTWRSRAAWLNIHSY